MWDAIREAVSEFAEGNYRPAWMLIIAGLGYLSIRILGKLAASAGTVAGAVWARYDKLLGAYERAVDAAKQEAQEARADALRARAAEALAIKEREEALRELANAEALIAEWRVEIELLRAR